MWRMANAYYVRNNKFETMILTKEQILTLISLKEVGVKGIGPKKIFSIAEAAKGCMLKVESFEGLHSLMQTMKEKAFLNVTLRNLSNAYDRTREIIGKSEDDGIGLIGYYDDEFPEILRHAINEEGKEEPPLLLWYRGDLSVLQMPGLAIIGTRQPTPEGVKGGRYLSGEFAKRGFNIVSGLALGCDTSAHQGALDVGGKTTAILANGLDWSSVYPKENRDLAMEIVETGGLLLSENRIGAYVTAYDLVSRDRLQAGLAMATIVIQTGRKGGTWHAANTTTKAGKPLFAMKFKEESVNNHEMCTGNAMMVRSGAQYIGGGDNIEEICETIMAPQKEIVQKGIFD